MIDQFRTIAHGTCAVNGNHTAEEYAAECPALGRNAEERLERFRAGRQGVHSGSPSEPLKESQSGAGLKGGFSVTPQSLAGAQARLGRPGRPTVPESEQRQKARERSRFFRARERQQVAAASSQAI